MAIEIDTFVDTHCHMFTVADVPLHESLSRNIKHPLTVVFGGLLAGFGFQKYEKFIKFFDQESPQNVEQIVIELKDALAGDFDDAFHIETGNLILTPLVMDFDRNGNVEKFEGQVRRLVDAAKAFKDMEAPAKDVKVLPFIGLDPRRFVFDGDGMILGPAEIKADLKTFLQSRGVIDENSDGRLPRTSLKSGDILGVKLYPPLGFHVYPNDSAEREGYLAVYELLAEYQIPITVHCQEGSYNLADNDLVTFTHPKNWGRVLETNENLAKLRINLGHFGGESEVAAAIEWTNIDDSHQDLLATGPTHTGWSSEIIKLLKKYEHTYADISAFDYRQEKCCASLLWLLAYDEAGKFDEYGAYPLAKKLMWGSDYPMILNHINTSYRKYFSDFVNSVIDRNPLSPNQECRLPNENDLSLAPETLLKALVGDNPTRFLFG